MRMHTGSSKEGARAGGRDRWGREEEDWQAGFRLDGFDFGFREGGQGG